VRHSDYFRTALHENWKEGQERLVVLDDVEPATFDIFVNWLYTKKLPEKEVQWIDADDEKDSYHYNCQINLFRLKVYVVADRLGAQEFLAMVNNDYMDSNIDRTPWYENVIYAFSNIPSGRRILRFLVATHCALSCPDGDDSMEGEEELRSKLPREFLLQVMMRYQVINTEENWNDALRACDYHEHASEEEREKCSQKKRKA
jgi:hypothetical protein